MAYFNEPVLNKFVKRAFEESDLEYPTLILHSTNIERINSLVRSSKAVTFSDTFTQSMRKHSDDTLLLDLEPSQWFHVGVLESPALKNNAGQRAYVQQLRALIGFKHRHYLTKYTV